MFLFFLFEVFFCFWVALDAVPVVETMLLLLVELLTATLALSESDDDTGLGGARPPVDIRATCTDDSFMMLMAVVDAGFLWLL